MPFAATWMDLEIIILSKICQRQIYDFTYMWNLKIKLQIKLYTKQKQTHRHRKQTCLKKGEMGEGPIRSMGLIDINYYT